MSNEQKTLAFTETGQPELTYAELERLCELPAKQRADAIARRAPEIVRVIGEDVMCWRNGADGGSWFKGEDVMFVMGNFDPLRNLNQAVAAMDKMIASGWGFVPKWNGLDFSAVDAFHYEKRLHVRALYWGDQPERHAVALALTVALATLLEKDERVL